MTPVHHLSLGRRIGLAFAAVLALLACITGVALRQMAVSGEQLQNIVEVHNRQIALASRVIDQIKEMAITVRNASLLTDIQEIDAQLKQLATKIKDYEATEAQLAQALQAPGTTAREKELLQQIQAARAKTLPLINQAGKLGGDGANVEATLLLMRQVRPAEQQWRDVAAALVETETQLNADAYAAARSGEIRARWTLLIAGTVALVVGALLAWRLTRGVLQPVAQAIAVTERIAEGDLSSPVQVQRHDELGRLLGAVAGMQQRLQTLVGDIRHSVDSISVASGEIASGNQDLSRRTEQQAASLQKTAASMDELSSTVGNNAEAAMKADQLANSASQIAARGGEVVQQVVSTMDEINTSSKKIADIIGVIDGIAFQTNILALNAAVEAARAGEQGRGFAVVAGEVRSLAQRSAEAAKEIKALIGASTDRVEAGAKLVQEAGSTMEEIVASVRRVTDIMSEITVSSREQSTGIGQVSGEVSQLDQMTQQNAALVEQSTAATESLREQAGRLSDAVRVFKLETQV